MTDSAYNILVVDDDPGMLAVASEELQANGYAVFEAGDGREALSAMEEAKFDLIISDLEMPRMNGLELVRAIRALDDDTVSQTPVIMLTGRGDDKAIQAAFDCGASSFVQKPVNWLNFMHHLVFILRAGVAEHALRSAHKAAKKAATARKELMSNLRHELRTPLHVITGYADVLKGKSTSLDESTCEAVDFMRSSAVDINARLAKIFLLSDLIGGDVNLTIRPASPKDIFSAVVSDLGRNRDLDVSGVEIDIPRDTLFDVDYKLFMIAAESLVENAVKFGAGRVLISCPEQTAEKTIIEISDDGEGFEADTGRELLKAFSQGDSGLTRKSTGLGLGLTTANMLIELHNGSIKLGRSQEMGGALVTISL